MAGTKTATLTFRIEPGLKEALRTAAAREHRSIVNMVEVMIREYCGRAGAAIADPMRAPANRDHQEMTQTIGAGLLSCEDKIWETADTLRGAGIKASEWLAYMMPFFALMMLESRRRRFRYQDQEPADERHLRALPPDDPERDLRQCVPPQAL